MKVTRYFVGFGPTLWSFGGARPSTASRRIPLGGFVQDRRDDRRWTTTSSRPTSPARCSEQARLEAAIVMSAGSIMHFLPRPGADLARRDALGLPNRLIERPAQACVQGDELRGDVGRPSGCQAGDPVSPARQAGLRRGDKITGDQRAPPVATNRDLVKQIRRPAAGHRPRSGTSATALPGRFTRTIARGAAQPLDDPNGDSAAVSAHRRRDHAAATRASRCWSSTARATRSARPGLHLQASPSAVRSLAADPAARCRPLWTAITGGERATDSPISVVGAARLGGEAVQQRRPGSCSSAAGHRA